MDPVQTPRNNGIHVDAEQPTAIAQAYSVARRRRLVQLHSQVPISTPSAWVKNPLSQIAELPYLSASLSVVDDETVFVRIRFPNEVDADIQYHCSGDAFVALYRTDRSVWAGSGTIPAVVADLHGLLGRI